MSAPCESLALPPHELREDAVLEQVASVPISYGNVIARGSSDRLHAAPSSQAVADPEDVRDVDAPVVHAVEDAQRLPNTVRTPIDTARRQLDLVLVRLLDQSVHHRVGLPPLRDLLESARND